MNYQFIRREIDARNMIGLNTQMTNNKLKIVTDMKRHKKLRACIKMLGI